MKTRTSRAATRLTGIATLALATVLGAATAATAATQDVTYNLQTTAVGMTVNSTMTFSVTATQPASVASGAAFTDVLSTGSITVPSSSNGYTIKQIQDIKLRIPVPSNSTYVSAALSGGSGLGSAKPTLAQSGGTITITVPGPIAGGKTFTLPTLTLNLKAGSSGTTVSTTLSGTSYSNPGLTFTAVSSVIGIPINGSSVGYPSPSPVLGTTAIS
jgi:dehydratase